MQRVRKILFTLVFFLVAIPVARLLAWRIPMTLPITVMQQVIPEEAAHGQTVMVTGYPLDAANVRDVYLIDASKEYRVEILDQANRALRFRVPSVPGGRMRLAFIAPGYGELMEQSVFVTVLESRRSWFAQWTYWWCGG
jgi:hypothetical protein